MIIPAILEINIMSGETVHADFDRAKAEAFAPATNTVVRGNVVVGNPPVQQSVGIPASIGVDIWDQSPSGATTFDRNICVTAINAPCPDLSTTPIPRKPDSTNP
jgi:hypothetical protein